MQPLPYNPGPMFMRGGYISATALGVIYWIGCYVFLGISHPAWWELCVLGGLGAFASHNIRLGILAGWQTAKEMPKHPGDVVNNKWMLAIEIVRVFLSRGLLAGTALWLISKVAG